MWPLLTLLFTTHVHIYHWASFTNRSWWMRLNLHTLKSTKLWTILWSWIWRRLFLRTFFKNTFKNKLRKTGEWGPVFFFFFFPIGMNRGNPEHGPENHLALQRKRGQCDLSQILLPSNKKKKKTLTEKRKVFFVMNSSTKSIWVWEREREREWERERERERGSPQPPITLTMTLLERGEEIIKHFQWQIRGGIFFFLHIYQKSVSTDEQNSTSVSRGVCVRRDAAAVWWETHQHTGDWLQREETLQCNTTLMLHLQLIHTMITISHRVTHSSIASG